MKPGLSFDFYKGRGRILKIVFIVFALILLMIAYHLFLKDRSPVVNMNIVQVPDSSPPASNERILRVAVGARISPESTTEYYYELLKIVGEKLGMKVLFSQKKTYAELNNQVKQRDVDLAYVCSGPFVKGNREFGMELLVVPVVHGKTTYHSYIIVPAKSKFNCFDDLRGMKFAFSDPDSNTGYLVPRSLLSEMGETPGSFFRETFFSYSHDNSIRAVSEGQADGAAVDSLVWDFFNEAYPSLTARTRIIWKSEPFGIPPFVIHPDLEEGIKEKMRAIFLQLDRDPRARKLMNKIQIQRFVKADLSIYDSVIRMKKRIKNSGE